MEADDFRRSLPCRRSCATRTPSGPANGNSAGISQRLSPDCLFTMPIFFTTPDCHRQKYRHSRVYRSIKTSHKPWPAPASRTANSQAILDVFNVSRCYFSILQAWLLTVFAAGPPAGRSSGLRAHPGVESSTGGRNTGSALKAGRFFPGLLRTAAILFRRHPVKPGLQVCHLFL
jgi:hypothetical protein